MKYLFIFLLLFPGLKSNSQTIFEINPNSTGYIKTILPYGSTVKFKITNVNPFKIEGTNSISKESISFDVPAQLSQPLTQVSNKDLQEVINTTEEEIESLQNISDSNGKNTKGNKFYDRSFSHLMNMEDKPDREKIKALEEQILKLKKEVDMLKKIQQLKDSIFNLKKEFINNFNGFVSTLNKLSLYTSVDSYIDSLLQQTFIIDTTTLKSNLRDYMISINDNSPDINLLREKCSNELRGLGKYYIAAKGAYDELAEKVKNEKVEIKDWEAKSKNDKIKIENITLILVREKIFEKEFEFLKAKYDTINKDNKRTQIITKANAGIDYYNRVKNAKFEVYTDAQQLNDDKITITPKLKNAKGDIIKEYNPVEIKTYGGWKVDVSTGYLLSFRGDENYTNFYESSGLTGVQKNKTDNLKHAIGALFNAYRRTGCDFNWGFSIGLSIPTDGTNIGFYAGVSALIMEKNRLVITLGLAENRIKVLNTGNLIKDSNAEKRSNKETYKFSNAEYKEIKYDNVYRPALFLGISYNIFTIKKAD